MYSLEKFPYINYNMVIPSSAISARKQDCKVTSPYFTSTPVNPVPFNSSILGIKTELASKDEKTKYNAIVSIADRDTKKQLHTLLKTGVLLNSDSNDHSTTLDNLYKIVSVPRAKGLNNANILKETVSTLYNPHIITQQFGNIPEQYKSKISAMSPDANVEHSGTCVASSIEFNLAQKHPAEFARFVQGLSSPKMCVEKTIKFSNLADSTLEAVWLLNAFEIPFKVDNFDEAKLEFAPDKNAIIRAHIQTVDKDSTERSSVDVLLQSTFMQVGSQQTYNTLTDKRTGKFNRNDKGLIEFEKTFTESVVEDKNKISMTYQKVDDNAKLVGFETDFATMKKHLADAIKMGENVIIGYTQVDGSNTIINGHEITITGIKTDKNGKFIFICNDTDDGISKPVEYTEDFLLPKIHHAALPQSVVANDIKLSENWAEGLRNYKQMKGTQNHPRQANVDVFYIADLHGKMTNMERICSMSKLFNKNNSDSVKLKLASGDILLGSNPVTNQVASNFLNWIGVTANALGNHELDAKPQALSKILSDAKYKLLAANITVKPNSPMANKIQKSMIEEHDGEKFGIIGIAPPDAFERVGTRESLDDISVDTIDTTIKKVQDEVNNLKAQGINKIIVLSHIGKENDKRLAQETDGIDIILGGHTHDLYKDIKIGDNLLKSKSGEPVLLTQIGKDGEYAGILKTVFDQNGILIKAQNNTAKTDLFSRILPFKFAIEAITGKPEAVANIKFAPPSPQNRLLSNNPHGNLIVDAMRKEFNSQIALLNAGNIRGYFPEGQIDARHVSDVTPFEDKMLVCELNEKQIVDALKVGAKSFLSADSKPGIILVSGLEYTITDKGKLVDLKFIDKDGTKKDIDINNPDVTRKYTVACDDFFAYGGDNYLPVNSNPNYVIKKTDFDKNICTMNYLKSLPQPVEIKADDRIKIIHEE